MRSPATVKVVEPVLPSNFAAKLCMKEVQLDEKCSFQLITELVTLYQKAIEYFEYKSDPRQHEFQNRLQTMLLRSDVIQQLENCNRKPSEASLVTSIASPVIEEAARPVLRRRETTPVPRPIAPENLFDQHASGTLHALESTRRDLKQQHSALVLRLQRRNQTGKCGWKDKSSGLIDSALPTGDTEMDDSSFDEIQAKEFLGEDSFISPRGGSVSPIPQTVDRACLDSMELEYDEIMEQSFSQKTKRIEEIREKFKQQLRELEEEIKECGGNKLLEQVAERMRKDMEGEVNTAVSEVEAQRKDKIRAMKTKYWGK